MFLGENANGFFWTPPAAPAASREFANHRAGSQLKIIKTFVGYKMNAIIIVDKIASFSYSRVF